MDTNPGVSIIIVKYNGMMYMPKCLESINQMSYPNYEIIVVDNKSTDGSLEMLKARKDIKLIKLDKNYGAYKGWNAGLKHAKHEYVCMLNNDIIVDRDWLSELVKTMKDPSIAGTYASFFDYGENVDRGKNIERIKHLRSGTFTLLGYIVGFNFFPDYVTTSLDADPGCYLIRKSLVDEFFDADYFIYFGGMYLTWKLRIAGYDIKRSPLCMVYHLGATAASKKFRERYWYFLGERNRIMNLLIFYSTKTLVKILPLLLADCFKKLLVAVKNFVACPYQLIGFYKANLWLVMNFGKILKKRKKIQSIRKIDDSKIVSMLSYKWTDKKGRVANILNGLFFVYCKTAGLLTYDIIHR